MTDLAAAVEAIRLGRLVVIPTDTVYGVAASPFDPAAIEAVFAAKGRPSDKPLPVLGADVESLRRVAAFDERAERLAERHWPGPLTLVLRRAGGFEVALGDDSTGTVAVRVPAARVARELLAATGPLAVTSANRSGEKDPATVEEARAALGEAVAVYLDGGRGGGSPSTIVSLVDEPRVVRAGALAPEAVLDML